MQSFAPILSMRVATGMPMPPANAITRATLDAEGRIAYSTTEMPMRDGNADVIGVTLLGERSEVKIYHVLTQKTSIDSMAARAAAQLAYDANRSGIDAYNTVAVSLIGSDNENRIGRNWRSFLVAITKDGLAQVFDAKWCTFLRQSDGMLCAYDGVKMLTGLVTFERLYYTCEDLVPADHALSVKEFFAGAVNVNDAVTSFLEHRKGAFLARFGEDVVLTSGRMGVMLSVNGASVEVAGFIDRPSLQAVNERGAFLSSVISFEGDLDQGNYRPATPIPLEDFRRTAIDRLVA